MGTIVRSTKSGTGTTSFGPSTTAKSSEVNTDFNTIYSEFNGNIDNDNIKSSAAIVDTKLAQIATASKVHGSSITGLASVPAGAGVIPAANLTSVAQKGANSDITSLSGLTTALSIAQGGTGQTTATLAINALLPDQSSANGRALVSNGSVCSWGSAINSYAAGSDYLIYSLDTEKSVTNMGSYYIIKSIIIPRDGTLRISFDFQSQDQVSPFTSYARIYRNGVAVGTERSHIYPNAYQTFSEDISGWSIGDTVELQIKTGSGSYSAAAKNFRLYATIPTSETTVYDRSYTP